MGCDCVLGNLLTWGVLIILVLFLLLQVNRLRGAVERLKTAAPIVVSVKTPLQPLERLKSAPTATPVSTKTALQPV